MNFPPAEIVLQSWITAKIILQLFNELLSIFYIHGNATRCLRTKITSVQLMGCHLYFSLICTKIGLYSMKLGPLYRYC